MPIRRRHLPHVYAPGCPLFVTYRLQGSLPRGHYFAESLTSAKAFACMDQLLDRECCGPLYLRIPEIAGIVTRAIQAGGREDYALHAWVVMPNHVHLLITPAMDVPTLLRRLKGVTAREANRVLARRGPLWQHESYDRLVRDEREFCQTATYIENNPVRAGLVPRPEDYPWSSARTSGR